MLLAICAISLAGAIGLSYFLTRISIPDPKLRLLGGMMGHHSSGRLRHNHLHLR